MLHGGDIYGVSKQLGLNPDKWIDYSANINPLGTPENIIKAMQESIHSIMHYPDPLCRELTHEIGITEGLDEKTILCGNGAADLIFRLVYALNPKKALLVAPTFLEYEEALNQVGTHIDYYSLDKEYQIDRGILEVITKNTDIIFICNPNNPTGILTEPKLLVSILKKAKEVGSYLIVDECFLDFVYEKEVYSLLSYIKEYDRLLILKSFTKMYGIPGIRLGYIISNNKDLLQKMIQVGQTWSVNSIAQKAGIAALQEKEFVDLTVSYVKKEREYLKSELENIGLTVLPGSANYLLFYGYKLEELYDQLLKHSIIIRSCRNYKGLTKNHYRIAVRNHEDNMYLINALKSVIKVEES